MELKLYKLINSSLVDDFHWDGDCFIVFISYYNAYEFMQELNNMFGYGIHDDGGIPAVLKDTYLGFDLTYALEGYVDLEEVFSKED